MIAALLWDGKKILLRGNAPERGAERLKKAGVALFDVKKTQKDAITFIVYGKQARKVFAIYPKTWYNKAERGGIEASVIGEYGALPLLKRLKNRTGVLVGAAAFLSVTAFCDGFVFGVKYTGDTALCLQAERIVKARGVAAFSRFDERKENALTGEILRLDGAGYAAVQKRGTVVYIEVRRSAFANRRAAEGDMKAKHAGKLISLTALSGQSVKAVGDEVKAGEILVSSKSALEEGGAAEKRRATVSAMAEIECVFEFEIEAETEARAKAVAAFLLDERERGEIYAEKKTEILKNGERTFLARITYVATETMNY